MLKLLLRNSYRSLVDQRPYSFVNILGLTIGVSSVLILITWISLETSYENFLKDKERIYRVGMVFKTPNRIINSGSINAPAGPEFKREFPVVEEMTRFTDNLESVIYKDRTNKLEVYYTDSTFFDLFSFDLVAGDRKTCLESPQGIVLTEKAVRKIYGQENPLGKELLIAGNTFYVTAVAKDPPLNTSMLFECLAPLTFISKQMHEGWDGGLTCYTYLRLTKGADLAGLQQQITRYMKGAINDKYNPLGYSLDPYLEKITDLHLDPDIQYDIGEKGSKTQIIMFSGIGLLILLIACFNFVNISTALSFKRSKEISVKKIFGSERRNVILFFVFESAAAIIIALLLALIMVRILLPHTSGLIGRNLSLSAISTPGWIIIFVLLFIFCTIFASFYSAFYLSSINPLALLTTINRGKRKQFSRDILVTFQYTISIGLIICCLVIYSQMRYIKYSDKGFNENDILVVNLNARTALSYELIAARFSSVPGVISVTVSAGGLPGVGFTSNGYAAEGVEKRILANAVYVDENYVNTLGISLLDGRDFRNPKADSNKVIINQTFVKLTGWDNPIGKFIERSGIRYEVIGEVRDFNTSSLHSKTEPLFISTVNEWQKFDNVLVKFLPKNITSVITSSEKILKEIDPQDPFEYSFLEDTILQSYSEEKKLNLLFLVLSAIAVIISCLGLFGMATFSTQSRLKEISIRKINGALISDIFWRFNFELLKWILISFLVAIPVAYYAMTRWLDNFAYKTSIGAEQIIAAGLAAIAVGLLTVSWAAMKAARSNPAETLRKE
jgi:putative ABC transport system permease protein